MKISVNGIYNLGSVATLVCCQYTQRIAKYWIKAILHTFIEYINSFPYNIGLKPMLLYN